MAALAALVLLAYLPVRDAGFSSDDELYVLDNPVVRGGYSATAVARAFSTPVAGNWHPLTVLSLAFDARLWGAGPRGFHLANVAYHALAVSAAFLALCRMTGAPLRAATVAAVFAAHPLHVESVAWISGRKDVLSGLLFWLALGAYHGYTRRPSRGRWALVTVLFALGLTMKPILVALPPLLLVLDVWPLNRARDTSHARRRLLAEKLPWLAISMAAGMVAVATQSSIGALQTLENLPLSWRLRNACISVVEYLREAFWPAALTPLHPFSHDPPSWGSALLAFLLLAGLTGLAVWQRRRRPSLLAGWLWFAVLLLPVAGIVQVGGQRMADRYLYLPLAGLSIGLAWIVSPLHAAAEVRLWLGRAAAVVCAVVALASMANAQAHAWTSEETLYRHTLANLPDGDRWLAFHRLGLALFKRGALPQAAEAFAEAIGRRRDYAPAYSGLATVYLRSGNLVAALAHYQMALLEAPEDVASLHGEGLALAALGRHGEAVTALREALRLEPGLAAVAVDLGRSLEALGRRDEALAAYRQALKVDAALEGARRALTRLTVGGRP